MLQISVAKLWKNKQTAKRLVKYVVEMVEMKKDELKKMQWFVYSSKKM